MSRFTLGATQTQQVMYKRKSTEDQRKTFEWEAWLSDDEKANLNSHGLWVKKSKKGMVGALAVRDVKGNRHHIITRTSLATKPGQSGLHVEPLLLVGIGKEFEKTGRLLNAAKVVISLLDSPCRDCSKTLLSQCRACATKLTKDGKNCYFVFNFSRIYCHSKEGFQKDQWKDEDEAWERYNKITAMSGMTGYIVSNEKKVPKRYPVVNFRQIDGADVPKLPAEKPPVKISA